MGPQNGIVGDDFGTSLPETKIDQEELIIEKKAAKFSKTAEYRKLKEHLEGRIDFYQQFLPDGRPVSEAPTNENWIIANAIIGEFKAVINAYEQARQVVEEAAKKNV